MIESCENFIKEVESLKLNTKNLPDVKTYQMMIESKRKRVTMLYDLFQKANNLYIETNAKMEWYHERLAEVEKENYMLKCKNEELSCFVNKVKNSPIYKLASPIYKGTFIKKKK